MMNDYYQQKLFLAKVDEKDTVIGQVERWEAHEKGILHRGFTLVMTYENKILIQHRKHPAFDAYWDFTFSSHMLYKDGELETDIIAIYRGLQREWNLVPADLVEPPILKGKVYYQAKDPKSIYSEHEWDYIYFAALKKLPIPNPAYAYGFELIDSMQAIKNEPERFQFAPWVEKIMNEINIT